MVKSIHEGKPRKKFHVTVRIQACEISSFISDNEEGANSTDALATQSFSYNNIKAGHLIFLL